MEKIYLEIWNLLNQKNLSLINHKNFNKTDLDFRKKSKLSEVRQYFNDTSKYKIINIRSASEEERKTLKSLGLSLRYLRLNLNTDTFKDFKSSSRQNRITNPECAYAICPTTGTVLSSNLSLPFGTMGDIQNMGYGCYRFVGEEIFYLITGIPAKYTKLYLYFPNKELIILLPWKKGYLARSTREIHKFNSWKAYMVTDWERIYSYLISETKVKKALVFGHPNLGHYFMDLLPGIQEIIHDNTLEKIDKILICSKEHYNKIDEIFPEISSDKIQRIRGSRGVNDEVLENNYFAFRYCKRLINEELVNRVYEASRRKCSSNFLTNLEKARKIHSPLVWIGIRSNRRVLLSQVEGISNIIKNLYSHFPKLGVVFDGFCRTGDGSASNSKEEEAIKRDLEVTDQIQALIPPEVKVYNLIGCQTYENLVWAYAIDLYLSTSGTPLFKVSLFANKPGVVHGNRSHFQTEIYKARENGLEPVFVPLHHIIEVNEGELQTDYDCDWRVMYEELLNLAHKVVK